MEQRNPIAEREKFIEGWNNTMVKIWCERIHLLKVIDTRSLLNSVKRLPIHHDGRFYDFTLSQEFLEYGIWQDFGSGREIPIGNPGDLPILDPFYREEHNLNKPKKRGPKWGGGKTSGFPRQKRAWFSIKYFSSVMRLRDFMGQSLGDEFKSMFCNSIDADRIRNRSDYYRRKGLS